MLRQRFKVGSDQRNESGTAVAALHDGRSRGFDKTIGKSLSEGVGEVCALPDPGINDWLRHPGFVRDCVDRNACAIPTDSPLRSIEYVRAINHGLAARRPSGSTGDSTGHRITVLDIALPRMV